MNIFKEANNKLEYFIHNNIASYHELRNYDYGIENRTNISQISKYLSHRILYEYDIIEKLKTIDKKKKYTDEILWRIYWRGYIENYKSIWYKYINFKSIKYYSNQLEIVTDRKTGIGCFDKWIEELRENNYLHNHSRMWFASIWIFSLRLPWQLGAIFFMRYLLDGDSASNTLSWRWVAGLHTNKRPYIASKENIIKYTINRFKDFDFQISKRNIVIKDNPHQSNKLPVKRNNPKSNDLIMFDNDLNILNRSHFFNSYSKVYIIINRNIEHNFRLSSNVIKFKQDLISNVNKLIINSVILNSRDFIIKLNDFKCIDVIYPGVGNNLDFINKYSKQKNINVNYIYREEDLFYWNYATSGFFKFKKSFYKIKNAQSYQN